MTNDLSFGSELIRITCDTHVLRKIQSKREILYDNLPSNYAAHRTDNQLNDKLYLLGVVHADTRSGMTKPQ